MPPVVKVQISVEYDEGVSWSVTKRLDLKWSPDYDNSLLGYPDEGGKSREIIVGEIVSEVSGNKEVLANMLLAGLSHALRHLGVLEQVDYPVSTLLDSINQVAGFAIDDLQRDTANVASNYRTPLPQSLRNYQPEAFPH